MSIGEKNKDSLATSKSNLQEELRAIREIANDTAQHYTKFKKAGDSKVQLIILTNEDGTYEFIE